MARQGLTILVAFIFAAILGAVAYLELSPSLAASLSAKAKDEKRSALQLLSPKPGSMPALTRGATSAVSRVPDLAKAGGGVSILSGVEALRARAAAINAGQHVFNIHLAPDLFRDPQLVVIVAMCHNRASYFLQQLSSLRRVPGIERALLVISQDVFDDDYEAALQTIDFMPYMRLFFPDALQLHPTSFPGTFKARTE